jgi:hypothetical protein
MAAVSGYSSLGMIARDSISLMLDTFLDTKNTKEGQDEISTINSRDDEIPDFKDSKEFVNENQNTSLTKCK